MNSMALKKPGFTKNIQNSYYQRVKNTIRGYCRYPGRVKNGWDARFIVEGIDRDRDFKYLPTAKLSKVLENGTDIYRSLQSTRGLLFFIDIDLLMREKQARFSECREKYLALMEPVYRSLCSYLDRAGIKYLVLFVGSGYHFIFRVPFGTNAFHRLVRAGRPHPKLLQHYGLFPQSPGLPLSKGEAEAFNGMGRLVEFILRKTVRIGEDLNIGNSGRNRVNLDLSTYSDPLHLRFIRCAGSLYQKYTDRSYLTLIRRDRTGNELDLRESLAYSADPVLAPAVLQWSAPGIPDAGRGLEDILEQYSRSDLARWHHEFDRHEPDGQQIKKCLQIIQNMPDIELRRDEGLRRAFTACLENDLTLKNAAEAVACRYSSMKIQKEVFRWYSKNKDGYNPHSRATVWARIYGYDMSRKYQ